MYVYHFKRKNMIGDILMPLNMQKKNFPELYKDHVKKYIGREKLLTKKIPILDCLWNDVLHFSPINPQLILDVYKKEGLVPESRKGEVFDVYRIPINKLPKEQTICFQSYNYDYDKFDPNLNKYWKFSAAEYYELLSVPDKQVEIWHQDLQAGRTLFWYSHIMHVLSKTEVNISDCEVLQCQ